MIACEIILLTALLTLAVYAAYKDCRTSQIPNRLLLAFALLARVAYPFVLLYNLHTFCVLLLELLNQMQQPYNLVLNLQY